MARNDIPNVEKSQAEANSVIDAFVNKVGKVLRTEDENQIGNIINILKNDADKIMLLLTPENQQKPSDDLDKLIQNKKNAIKSNLKWNGVKINQHSPYMTLVLFAVIYLSSRNSSSLNDYQDYVKTFNLDESQKLCDLIETVIDLFSSPEFSTGKAAPKQPTKEEVEAAKRQHNDQSKFARWYINSFGMAFDSPDLRCYMKLWNKALKEHINSLEKETPKASEVHESNPDIKVENKMSELETQKKQQSNDSLKPFDSWVSFQDNKPSKDNRSFGLARTFISKTSGSQEFIANSLSDLIKKYGRCKTKPREIVIQFWNDCIGTYNAENGTFTIDAEKFEKSKRDSVQLENNKKKSNKKASDDSVKKSQQMVSKQNSKPETSVQDSDVKPVNIKDACIKQISELTEKIKKLSAEEDAIRTELEKKTKERLVAEKTLTMLQQAQEKTDATQKVADTTHAEARNAQKAADAAQEEFLKAQQQLQELLRYAANNQK